MLEDNVIVSYRVIRDMWDRIYDAEANLNKLRADLSEITRSNRFIHDEPESIENPIKTSWDVKLST